MQEDSFPAAERILSDMESVFIKDPELKEFDILPITLNQNKSPVHHVENCLGLELWCVRHVYCYAYHRLLDMRQQKNRRTDPEMQCRLLMGALLLNPDVQTFWNMRRELVQACRLDSFKELHFTAVVLSRKPKCAEAFAYRKWIVTKLLAGGVKQHSLLPVEFQVVRAAANRYANNYHAWQHSIWCLVHLAPCEIYPEVYLEEWATTRMWATMHISDHSGWQYRQHLLQQLCGPLANKIPCTSIEDHLFRFICPLLESNHELKKSTDMDTRHAEVSGDSVEAFQCSVAENIKECSSMGVVQCLNFVLSELDLSTDLITRYPGHEALWYHRRFLLSFLKSLLDQNNFDTSDNENSSCMNPSSAKHRNLFSSVALSSYHFKSGQVFHSQASEVSHGAASFTDVHNVYERVKEMLKLVIQALPKHEEQLLSSCVGGDKNQQRFSSQYNKWLVQVLGMTIAF